MVVFQEEFESIKLCKITNNLNFVSMTILNVKPVEEEG